MKTKWESVIGPLVDGHVKLKADIIVRNMSNRSVRLISIHDPYQSTHLQNIFELRLTK